MREVDLDELEAPAAHGPAPRPARRRLSWRWTVTAAVVVVATLVMLQTAVDARRQLAEDHQPRAVRTVPPPERALAVLWKLDGAAARAVRVGTELVGATVEDGVVEVVGIDPATGARTWTVSAPTPGGLDTDGAECAPLGASGRAVCVGTSQVITTTRPSPVVVVDTTTWTLVGAWTSELRAWREVGDLVVTAAPEEDGSTVGWTLTAHDTSGAVVWTTRTSRAPVEAPDVTSDANPLFGHLEGADEWVAIADRGHAWVVGADGTVLADQALPTGFVGATRSGALAVSEHDPDGSIRSSVRLGGGVVEIPGFAVAADPDDGSAPGVDLYGDNQGARSSLVARDAGTGEKLWLDVDAGAFAVHDGVVLVTGSDVVSAYDAVDGTRLWQTRLAGVYQLTLDGDVVVAVAPQNLTVVGLDLRTGRALWKGDARDADPTGGATDGLFLSTWQGLLSVGFGDDEWVIG
ncbi:hypothetical protein Cch01nite_32640 [Cellulomonas chitinilytica]|uniref:Pyrrolo-quinoline quinone repeat domain-containing protein n=2 Tax=Cellulomonas chitinilytica TaxID=398759 RepID=A0A919P4G9_9CELL|nr:hypothetical protein Cch01nite_32640 [Cellulomonas chitinilytica]